jgi:hypothetical protein
LHHTIGNSLRVKTRLRRYTFFNRCSDSAG